MSKNIYLANLVRSCVYIVMIVMGSSCVDPPSGIRVMSLDDKGLAVVASPGMRNNIDYTCGKLSKLIPVDSISHSDIDNVLQIIYDSSDQVDEVTFDFTVLSSESLEDGEYIVEVFGYLIDENRLQREREQLIDSAKLTILNGALVESR